MTAGISSNREYDRTSYILIVDDDNTLLKFFKIHLNKFFSRVIVVKNAKEAVDTMREKTIDLVISDIRMPKVDGLQLLKKVRAHDPLIPVLLISGATLDPAQEDEAIKLADGYLRKPFGVDDLNDFIDRGMQMRDAMVKLATFTTKKKEIRLALHGETDMKKIIKDADSLKQANALVASLKKSA